MEKLELLPKGNAASGCVVLLDALVKFIHRLLPAVPQVRLHLWVGRHGQSERLLRGVSEWKDSFSPSSLSSMFTMRSNNLSVRSAFPFETRSASVTCWVNVASVVANVDVSLFLLERVWKA